ncbi:MAG: hypothetical protein V6Z81_03895 [Parvularculales bacterium]
MAFNPSVFVLLSALLFFVAACGGGPEIGESLYRSGEVGVAKAVQRCRVLEVREIFIRDDNAEKEGQALGGLAGGILGSVAGRSVGSGSGQDIASTGSAIAGVLGGALVGEAVGKARGTRKGLEYSILTDNGQEITFTQEFLEGDRIVQAGETCRLQVADNRNRVLPSEQLPETVQRPKTTTFAP